MTIQGNRAARLRREQGIPPIVVMDGRGQRKVIYVGNQAHTATRTREGWRCGKMTARTPIELGQRIRDEVRG